MSNLKKTALFAAAVLISQTLTLSGASADAVCFVLREYDGKIALFQENEAVPLAVYETPLKSLYPADAQLLREGIRVKSESEISRLIEDLNLE